MLGRHLAYRIVFETFDTDNDGWLDADELRSALIRLGGSITRAQTLALAGLSKSGGSARIDPPAFIDLLTASEHPSDAALRRAFDALDVDSDGVLTATEVSGLMSWVGVHADAEVQDWIREMDANSDGKVTFEEFAAAVVPS